MSVKATGSLTIGLDIGIASVGWAVLAPDRIVALGVRAFDKAENEKGKPLNLARRMARTTRTRLERRALRLKRLRRLLRDAGLVPSDDRTVFTTPPRLRADPANDPWHLRAEALDRRLTPEEWARVLYHLVKHRGFYSARKSEMAVDADSKDEKTKEKQGLLAGVKRTAQLLGPSEHPRYRTLGELAAKDEAFAPAKRNKAGAYTNSFSRLLLREELRTLFNRQQELGNPKADESLSAQVDELFWHQKPALSGDAMLKLLGRCTFEKDEYRAAKRTWSTERFVWLTRINNLRITHNGERRALSEAERQVAIDLPYVQKTQPISYKHLRKALDKAVGFPDEAGFAGLSYRRDAKKDPEDEKLGECKGWHELRKALERAGLDKSWLRFSQDHALLDAIGTALSIFKTDDELRLELAKLALTDAEMEALLSVSFSDFIQLSIKALHKILPHMEAGKRYDEACEAAGYNHSQPTSGDVRSKLLPPLFREEVRQFGNRKKVVRIPILVKNPVVSRSLNQARKVLNALIREYGSPVAVHIELARDLSKSYEERREIKKGQDRFKDEKVAAVKLFKETFNGREPSARNQDLLKFRLYREQEAQCAYCQKPLEIERLLEIRYVEIDHVLPYSRSFDDTQNNKVLVHDKENREKGGRTPYEYLDGASDSERWHHFEAWVRGHQGLRKAKRERLLRRAFDEREAREFSDRNLTDTRYATRYFSNFTKQNLRFAESAGELPVLTPSGAFTNFLRVHWGLIKSRKQSDLHHALDACVVAAASHKLIKRVSDFHRRDELVQLVDGKFADKVTGEILSTEASVALGLHFPKPWENFRDELLARLSSDPKTESATGAFRQYDAESLAGIKPVWVSRAPKRRNDGALHQETIRSIKPHLGPTTSSKRVALKDLQLFPTKTRKKDQEDAEKVSKKIGELIASIVGANDPRNEKLIATIRMRMLEAKGDGSKAFPDDQPLIKPSSPDRQAPMVRAVKLHSTQNDGVHVRGGAADLGEMLRVEIFNHKNKYLVIPEYAICNEKRIKPAQTPIDADHLFSLAKNDYVRITFGDDIREGYFVMYESDGRLTLRAHDQPQANKTYFRRGITNATKIEKFHVDVLGNLYPARPEKRRGLA